jgi:Holliday junction resolvase RusA-like endonuclease
MIKFTIPLAPVTKKNSQRIVINRRTGRPLIMPSAKYEQYEREAAYFIPRKAKPIKTPVNVKCLFYMPTRRKCDLTNLLEAIDDIMVKMGLLADDDYTVIESHDGSRVYYDKENPRTEIFITTNEIYSNIPIYETR